MPDETSAEPESPHPLFRLPRLETMLGPKGPLAAQLPGFTPRREQLELARGVETALTEGRPCLAEAGTGVGKTLGYLVPLVRWLARHGGRAVISTHTLALQAQLVERDIPNLLAALPGLDIRPAVQKGRYNYLCLQDLEMASSELWAAGDPQFRQIQRWSQESDTGDVAELDWTFSNWSDVAANVDTCRQRECRFYDRCFYYRARKTAEESNLLVVNHSLFFADLRLRRIAPDIPHLLPPYDAVVFDEAHHVEEMATRAFGLEWGSQRVPQLVRRARRVHGVEQDRLVNIERLNETLLSPVMNASKAEAFLDEALAGEQHRADFLELRDELGGNLNALARDLTKLAEAANSPTDRDRANGLARTATRISTELKSVTQEAEKDEDADNAGYFRWYNTRRLRNGQAFTTLVRTPLSISTLVQESLFANTPRTVLVSATLASGQNFSYLKERLGLTLPAPQAEEEMPTDAPVEVIQGSPFDYKRKCLLYIPRTLGALAGGHNAHNTGATDNYADTLSDEVLALIEAARGRTFVLFTSHRMLKAIQDRLWNRCDYPLFVQGEMPNARLVDAFVKSGDGVLLGTNSFWEGVDVPGPALSCVILDKLPFAAPDSPTQRAREAAIREAGGDAFRKLSLPQTQVRLKQGFGRLLRTVRDRGVVAILDNRLWTKGYGRELLAELPPCPRTDDFRDVQAFFAEEAAPLLVAAASLPAGIIRSKEK